MTEEQINTLEQKVENVISEFRIMLENMKRVIELGKQAEAQKQKNVEERDQLTRQTTLLKQQIDSFNQSKEDFAMDKTDLAKREAILKESTNSLEVRRAEITARSEVLAKKEEEVNKKLEAATKLSEMLKDIQNREAEVRKAVEIDRLRKEKLDARERRITDREGELRILNEA